MYVYKTGQTCVYSTNTSRLKQHDDRVKATDISCKLYSFKGRQPSTADGAQNCSTSVKLPLVQVHCGGLAICLK